MFKRNNSKIVSVFKTNINKVLASVVLIASLSACQPNGGGSAAGGSNSGGNGGGSAQAVNFGLMDYVDHTVQAHAMNARVQMAPMGNGNGVGIGDGQGNGGINMGVGSDGTDNGYGSFRGVGADHPAATTDIADPTKTTRAQIVGAFTMQMDVVVHGGNGTNSVAWLTAQFWGEDGWEYLHNNYAFTLSTNEFGLNSITVLKTHRTGPYAAETGPVIVRINNPGEVASLRITRDENTISFDYSLDGGQNWLSAWQTGLSSFDEGDVLVKGDVWQGATMANCQLDGFAVDCAAQAQ